MDGNPLKLYSIYNDKNDGPRLGYESRSDSGKPHDDGVAETLSNSADSRNRTTCLSTAIMLAAGSANRRTTCANSVRASTCLAPSLCGTPSNVFAHYYSGVALRQRFVFQAVDGVG